MVHLLSLVLLIGVIDSLNPATVAPALYLAGGHSPHRGLLGFIAGVFTVNLAGGILLALGPGQAILALAPHPSGRRAPPAGARGRARDLPRRRRALARARPPRAPRARHARPGSTAPRCWSAPGSPRPSSRPPCPTSPSSQPSSARGGRSAPRSRCSRSSTWPSSHRSWSSSSCARLAGRARARHDRAAARRSVDRHLATRDPGDRPGRRGRPHGDRTVGLLTGADQLRRPARTGRSRPSSPRQRHCPAQASASPATSGPPSRSAEPQLLAQEERLDQDRQEGLHRGRDRHDDRRRARWKAVMLVIVARPPFAMPTSPQASALPVVAGVEVVAEELRRDVRRRPAAAAGDDDQHAACRGGCRAPQKGTSPASESAATTATTAGQPRCVSEWLGAPQATSATPPMMAPTPSTSPEPTCSCEHVARRARARAAGRPRAPAARRRRARGRRRATCGQIPTMPSSQPDDPDAAAEEPAQQRQAQAERARRGAGVDRLQHDPDVEEHRGRERVDEPEQHASILPDAGRRATA